MANNESMDTVLSDYLQNCRAERGSEFTHTSQMDPKGSFVISDDHDNFMKLFCDRLHLLGDRFLSGVAERPKKFMPVLADVDLKIPITEDLVVEGHFYTPYQVNQTIFIFNDILNHMVKDIVPEKHLICFVLEKTAPYQKGDCYKNGFHLHWPFLFLENCVLDIQIYPRVKQRLNEEQLYNSIPSTEHESGNNLDADLKNKQWLMYGSRKQVGLEGYHVSRIMNHNLEEITLRQAMEHHCIKNRREQVIVDKNTPDLEYYLPYILSIDPWQRDIKRLIPGTECNHVRERLASISAQSTVRHNMNMSSQELITVCDQLVMMLKPERADHHDRWLEVGWCLFNVLEGAIEGVDLWYNFSKKAVRRTHVNEERCLFEWNRMKKCSYTIGSLHYWARNDNPEDYAAYIRSTQASRIKDALQGGHCSLAKYLHDNYGDRYVCANMEKNLWYYFDGVRWKKTQQANSLQLKIDSDLINKVYEMINLETQKQSEEARRLQTGSANHRPSPSEAQSNRKAVEAYYKILGNLNTFPFRQNIIRQCASYFYDSEFLSKLDENPYLLGFENGVFDLYNFTFREGRPSDYISKNCGYDYVDFKSSDDPNLQEVFMFWRKVMVDEDVREFFLEYCGKILKAGNDDQKFLILSGIGSNGKSVATDLISETLGGRADTSYAGQFPTTLVTGKETQSSAANPELFRAKGRRIMWLTEPDNDDRINLGMIKRLTGNDTVYVRNLFSEGEDIKPTFKLGYICNKLPKLPVSTTTDFGTWRRILRIVFKSRFPLNDFEVPRTWEEQVRRRTFYRDLQFQQRLPNMRQAQMWIMIHYYHRYRTRNVQIPIPLEVTQALADFQLENDVYQQFINEMIRSDPTKSITLSDFYTAFKSWHNETYGRNSRTLPDRETVKKDLSLRPGWGDLVQPGNHWVGWRLKTYQDDLAEKGGVIVHLQQQQDEQNENDLVEEEEDEEQEQEEDQVDEMQDTV